MFIVRAVQAKSGDCLLLEYGTQAKRRFLLVDGGPAGTYDPHLKSVLVDEIVPHGGKLDRVVLSHVDTDHVTGLLDLLSELRATREAGEEELVSIGGLWHNSFTRAIDPGSILGPRLRQVLQTGAVSTLGHTGIALLGIGDGVKLRQEAQLLGIAINADLDDLIVVDTSPQAIAFGNLGVTVVGPTQANLDKLRAQWEIWLDTHEDGLLDGDPQTLANSDRSVPNLSSICLVAEAHGRTALLTGDARSDHILQGLETQGLLDGEGRVRFDLIKLPHHGSDRNATRTFFRKVTADRYLVSADGRHGNPDMATLIWIVEAAHEQGRQIEILVTNPTPSTQKLEEEYPPGEYGYQLVFRTADEASMAVVLG